LPLPTIDLPLSAYIPEDYVTELGTRLALYQRLAKIRSPEEVKQLAEEFSDRFGDLPFSVENLLYIVNLKVLGALAGLQSISKEDGQIVIRAEGEVKIDAQELGRLQGQGLQAGTTQLRLDIKRLGSNWREVLEKAVRSIKCSLQ
jgi:transcription-repair coupling factor (superfamily II helicase)